MRAYNDATVYNIDVAFHNAYVILQIMSNGDAPNPLMEAAEKLRREAYAQGWRAAIKAMLETTNNVATEVANQVEENFEIGDALAVPSVISTNRPGDPTAGSTPWYVLQAVRRRHGMTGSEVVSVVREGGHKVSEGSIRTALSRLGEKKLIVGRHRKWFPA